MLPPAGKFLPVYGPDQHLICIAGGSGVTPFRGFVREATRRSAKARPNSAARLPSGVMGVGSSSGIGHMITDSQALLNTGQIIFGIIVIGLIGLVSDFLFKAINRKLFPWSLA